MPLKYPLAADPMLKHSQKLYHMTTVFICLLALFISLFAFWAAARMADREVSARLEEVGAINENLALILKENTQSTFSEADFILKGMKEDIEDDGILDNYHQALLRDVLKKGVINQIAVADAAGDLIYSAVPTPSGINIADREHFKGLQGDNSDKIYISKPYVNRASGEPSIFISRRLNDKNGNFAGVVAVGFNQNYFKNLFAQLNLGQDYAISLTKVDGTILARAPGEITPAISEAFRRHPAVAFASQGLLEGSYRSQGVIGGINRSGTFAVLADYSLMVLVAVAEDTALAPAYARRNVYLGIAAAFSLVVLLAFAMMWRQIRRQRQIAEQLHASEQQLQASHQNLSASHEELVATEEELRLQYKHITQQKELLAALNETTVSLVEQLDADILLRQIILRASELVGTADGFICLLQKEKQVIEIKAGLGLFAGYIGYVMSPGVGMAGRVIQTGRSFVVENYSIWPERLVGSSLDKVSLMVQVPLKVKREVIGSFALAFQQDIQSDFGTHHVELLERFAGLASVALENARLYTSLSDSEKKLRTTHLELAVSNAELTAAEEELRAQYDEAMVTNDNISRQNELLAVLHETSLGLMNRLDVDDVLKTIAATAGRLTGAEHATVIVLDRERQYAERKIGVGLFAEDVGRRVKLEDGLFGEVYRQGRTVVVNDYSIWDKRRQGASYSDLGANMHVPLLSGGEVIGSFGIAFADKGRKITDADVALVERFAELASIALGNAWVYSELAESEKRLYASYEELTSTHEELAATEENLRVQFAQIAHVNTQISRQNAVLSTLHEITLALMNRLEIDAVLQAIIQRAAQLSGADIAFIMLLNPEEGYFERKIAVGIDKEDGGYRIKLGEGLVSEAYHLGRTVVVPDYNTWGNRIPGVQRIHANMHIPLKSGSEVVGTLGLAYAEPGQEFTAETISLLEQFAQLAAIALENATLHTNLKHELEERIKLESQKDAMLEAIPDLILIFDKAGVLLDYEKAAEFDYFVDAKEVVIGQKVEEMLPEEIARHFMEYIGKALATGVTQVYDFRMNRDGVLRYRETRFSRMSSTEVLVLVRDVTDARLSKERVEFLSLHDALTGVFNRTYFEEETLRLQSRNVKGIGVFVCDVDGLKLINDTLGHRQGDELLQKVAAILNTNIVKPDFVARIGGDEFAVVLYEPSNQRLEAMEKQYREHVAKFNSNNPQLPLSLSISWAKGSDGAHFDRVFKEADSNMYRQKMHQSQSIRSAIVNTMMEALEARDHITEGHADRLGELMERMGSMLELPQGSIPDLRLFAKFHDIGKVGISDSILNKPGRLTDEEMANMRRHCEIGFRIARSSPILEPISDWILKHQEYWNGQGYPLGIAGEEIPLECRILSIVDAYDAMTNDRPYRSAMSPQAAIAEIKRCSGTQFDPALAEKFIAMIEADLRQ
ncbi:MAG: GAF domain-containing protein [Negativicutes bacterium]|nr:GAF domain-containing protein [Negativicutes bacterium]